MMVPGPMSGAYAPPTSPVSVTVAASGLVTRDQVANVTVMGTVTGEIGPSSYMWSTTSLLVTFSSPSSITTAAYMVESTQNQTFDLTLTVTDSAGNVGVGTANVVVAFPNAPI